MQKRMMDWDDLRFVLAVERAGTLSAAAQVLGCNQSTVTRRLVVLRRRLGEAVLERRGGTYVLTGLGEALRPRLLAMEEEALAIERAARGAPAPAAGPVRLTTVESLATFFLAPRLPRFRASHPAIELELDVNRRSADLGRREADLALRLARPRQVGLVARRVGAMQVALYASPAYLARRRLPSSAAGDWSGHTVVSGEDTDRGTPEAALLARLRGAQVVLRSPSWLALTAAVEAGLGIGALPALLTAGAGLRRLAMSDGITARELWLIVHRDLQHVTRVRAVMDFVADAVRRGARDLAVAR